YAVDFDGDGKRDLWNNTVDTIGSVAHYFQIHGWVKNQPVTVRARVVGNDYKELLGAGMKPKQTLDQLKQRGISVDGTLSVDLKATLIALENSQNTEHWVGLQNFYVITRYNHSRMYAMAVYQLSEAFANPSALN
ncbi:MAG: membrane-bound lytic murein transglycosylase B, partial [Halothiobacillaceae bacterium]